MTPPVNVLSFDVRERDEGPVTLVLTPRVDGMLLTTLVELFEHSHEMTDPAGGYGGLIPTFYPYGPLDQYFIGKTGPHSGSALERIYVLGCGCGEVGCWPLTCLVTAGESDIRWSKFKQPYRPARDYSSFGPFVFERAQYENAVEVLRARLLRTGQ